MSPREQAPFAAGIETARRMAWAVEAFRAMAGEIKLLLAA
jgi:hypothetical protein